MEELELTYLAKELPDGCKSAPAKEMLDIYIPSFGEHPCLRVRKNGEKCEMTKKQPVEGTDSSRQLESTIPLTKEEYAELAQLQGKRVQKIRYNYTDAGIKYEIDVFRGDLEGLVLVDVEFESREAQATFKMPEWCLTDVTQEKFIAGGMLAGKKYSDIEEKLTSFGYKKLTFA